MLGDNIRILRHDRNLSRLKLANLCQLDDAGIYRIESGQSKNPSVHTIDRIAKILEVSIDDLLHKDFSIELKRKREN